MQKPFKGTSKDLTLAKDFCPACKSKLLSNECLPSACTHRNLDFYLQTGSVVDATGTGLEKDVGGCYLRSAWVPPAWQSFKKWWPKSLPLPSVSTLWPRGIELFDSCIAPGFPVWVEKKRPRMWVIQILLCSEETEGSHVSFRFCQDTVLSLMPIWFSFPEVETFLTFLMTSPENVKRCFSI